MIEADPGLRSVLADVLAEEGYGILRARGGADGLRIAQEHRPDAILLDLGLTIGPGLELLERLRAGEATRYVPVVAMTGGPPEAVAGREPQPDSVLPKPFDRMPCSRMWRA